MRCLYHTFAPSQALAVRSEAPSSHPGTLQHQHAARSEERRRPHPGFPGPGPAVQGPPSPAEAQPPLTFATGPPGELRAGCRRQPPPPLAWMSSSGFGNFQSSQECLLKCSRRREQKEQTGALLAPPRACRKQSAVAQTGRLHQAEEMDVAFWNLHHHKGKCLLSHRELGESGARRFRDLMTRQRQGHEGDATRHWTSSCQRCRGCPSLGEVSGGGRETWRCLSDLNTHRGTCIYPHTCVPTLILSIPRFS